VARFLTLRTHDKGGSVQKPLVVDCDPSVQPLGYTPVSNGETARWVAGCDVVLAIHGFNVPRPHGVGSLAALETALALPPNYRFFGVLWPGDFWIPVIDYPFEAAHAVTSGKYIAAYCNTILSGASSINFISHSLGGRVLLEAVQNLSRPAGQVCLAAGAVDDDCMVQQYLEAAQNAGRVSVLSSMSDKVLQLAYPAGDLISDTLLGDNDSPWEAALGRRGPKRGYASPPIFNLDIPTVAGPAYGSGFDCDHGDYFPPSEPENSPPADPKWGHATKFMRRVITGGGYNWD